ncbi:hypothetical protein CLF_106510 [Clonorchis sinensis]|uniref:Pol-related protein n=1 Tax=Clonorchis sinensis TaxID=79923 RepID=G7YF98_CLOSI|nr:hypothetical protein CLF_106510 [Clonorchis sinensis]
MRKRFFYLRSLPVSLDCIFGAGEITHQLNRQNVEHRSAYNMPIGNGYTGLAQTQQHVEAQQARRTDRKAERPRCKHTCIRHRNRNRNNGYRSREVQKNSDEANDYKPVSNQYAVLDPQQDEFRQEMPNSYSLATSKIIKLNSEVRMNMCPNVITGSGDSANSFVRHGEKGPEDITRIDAEKDLGIWLSPNLSFSLRLEKSAQKAFAVLRMIRRTFSRITRTDFQVLHGAYVRPLLEYANPVVYSGRTKDVILIERVQRAATKMVAGLNSMDYETRLAVLDLFPLENRRLRGDLILTYALFEQGLANRFCTVDPANTLRGHGERQLLNDKNKTDQGNLGKSLAPVYQSVNP